ncbi:hypothetical protein V8G57_11490 [Collimonas sp. H4R21]|uniref:Phage integrase family protein n=1 Tax=Collimonas rhizosphaerae TaxID=3126357 RepID=A0ABU9PVK8_9BURK
MHPELSEKAEVTRIGYAFPNPGRAKIRVRTEDAEHYVDTTGATWKWTDSGTKYRIRWNEIRLPETVKEIAKAYIFHRLESRSPHTVGSDASMIKDIGAIENSIVFPWTTESALAILVNLYKRDVKLAIFFRVFYCWCLASGKPGFSRETYFVLEETKLNISSPYQSLFLHLRYVTQEQEILVLRIIKDSYDPDDWHALRSNVLLHISFELAPRPSQLYALNAEDLEVLKIPSKDLANKENEFYSLWLPMAKKRGAGIPERRPKQISTELGNKIQQLIRLNEVLFGKNINALFLKSSRIRLSAYSISVCLIQKLEPLNLPTGGGATLLRHHLGQGLADQGAPADVIAEAMGHNSTVAARAYIAATPTIAKIKARALGKNDTYKSIMKMMLTGEIAARDDFDKERWVKGVVHTQYLVGIGGCDLPAQNHCPKNPIYSCYTCRDFHPFADGPHDKVRSALEMQAQFFIDAALKSMELDRSRVPVQLEQTLEAVDAVISRCNEK